MRPSAVNTSCFWIGCFKYRDQVCNHLQSAGKVTLMYHKHTACNMFVISCDKLVKPVAIYTHIHIKYLDSVHSEPQIYTFRKPSIPQCFYTGVEPEVPWCKFPNAKRHIPDGLLSVTNCHWAAKVQSLHAGDRIQHSPSLLFWFIQASVLQLNNSKLFGALVASTSIKLKSP